MQISSAVKRIFVSEIVLPRSFCASQELMKSITASYDYVHELFQ